MITTAPLPPLASLLMGSFRNCTDPAKPWLRTGETALTLSRSAWSLAFLARARGLRVVVPAWFCAQSLVPLRSVGAQITFLPVNADGQPDWSTAPAQFDLGLMVHVFGMPMPTAAARAACDRSGAWLVEDCAHCLGPAPGLGEAGDAVLYSPYKVLGMPEGAVLVGRGIDLMSPALPPAPSSRRWLLRRLIQMLLPDAARAHLPQGGQAQFVGDPPENQPEPATALSPLAARVMAAVDLQAEAAARRNNAALLRTAIGHLPGWQPFFDHDGPAPYRFVLQCADETTAAERYRRLRDARLPVESWPDLPAEVKDSADHFGDAVKLRRSLLLLPVHGTLPGARFARLVREALS